MKVFLTVALFLWTTLNAFASQPFITIDAYARSCPANAKTNLDALSTYLRKSTRTDLEKARSIYVWLTANISYDAKAFNTEIYGDQSPEGVLKSKKAVCAGFAELYTALGERFYPYSVTKMVEFYPYFVTRFRYFTLILLQN